MKEVDGMFDYRDRTYGNDSSCYLRVYRLADNVAVAIATELAENSGPSITNTAEALWKEVVKEYDLDPERTYFVEHYVHSKTDRDAGPRGSETFDLVEMKWFDGLASWSKWRPSSKAEIEKLVGESID